MQQTRSSRPHITIAERRLGGGELFLIAGPPADPPN